MLGYETPPIVLNDEQSEKVRRWLRGEFTPEEIEKKKEVEKRYAEARKRWKVIWKDNKYGDLSDI